jgi:hypothetical protein
LFGAGAGTNTVHKDSRWPQLTPDASKGRVASSRNGATHALSPSHDGAPELDARRGTNPSKPFWQAASGTIDPVLVLTCGYPATRRSTYALWRRPNSGLSPRLSYVRHRSRHSRLESMLTRRCPPLRVSIVYPRISSACALTQVAVSSRGGRRDRSWIPRRSSMLLPAEYWHVPTA